MSIKGRWTKISGWSLLHCFDYERDRGMGVWWVMMCGRAFKPQPNSHFTEDGSKCSNCLRDYHD